MLLQKSLTYGPQVNCLQIKIQMFALCTSQANNVTFFYLQIGTIKVARSVTEFRILD